MNIVFPIFDGVTQLDFTGPAQIFSRLPGARIFVAAASLSSIPTDCGFSIEPNVTFKDCPDAEILCVPGGPGTALACEDSTFMRFVGSHAAQADWITSVCTGMFVLGKLGLLKGKRATSHWAYTNRVASWLTETSSQGVVLRRDWISL
jgi:cyclohexyl-isocyanide hydratase